MGFEKDLDKFRILCSITCIVNIFSFVPLEIHKSDIKDIRIKSKSELKREYWHKKLVQLLCRICTFFQLCAYAMQCFHTTKFVLGLLMFTGLRVSTTFTYQCKNTGKLWDSYQNNLLQFKRKQRRKSSIEMVQNLTIFFKTSSLVEYLNTLFSPTLVVTSIIFTSVIFPFMLVLGVHWNNPCKPSLFCHFISKE